jgi:hypothetical protein
VIQQIAIQVILNMNLLHILHKINVTFAYKDFSLLLTLAAIMVLVLHAEQIVMNVLQLLHA